jgi:Undecaprenyl-phosphate glucose phosphotransferase
MNPSTLLGGATKPRAIRGSGPQASMVKSAKKINPKLFFAIVSLLESLIAIFSGLGVFLIIGGGNKLYLFIMALTGTAALSLHSLFKYSIAVSAESFIRLRLFGRLRSMLLSVVLPITCVSLLSSTLEYDRNDAFYLMGISRVLWVWSAASAAGAVILHICVWCVLRSWRARAILVQRIAIVGAGGLADRFVKWLEFAYPDLVEIVGVFDDRERERAEELPLRHLLRGTIDDLLHISRTVHIDRVVVALPHAAEGRLLYILQKLRRLPADITLAPDLIGFAAARDFGRKGSALPLFDIYACPLRSSEQLAKGIFDRVVAAGLIVLFLPTLLLICLAIFLESPGPILFRQLRYGLGHQVIAVLKFRTMYYEFSDYNCVRQTELHDKRTTRIGRWLRRLSLDELPQLFNILRGEMSLVGPRPLATEMRVENQLNHDLVSEYCYRHRVKPGITGWAQIHGLRGAIYSREALLERVLYDLYYIDNWSFWLDLRILLLTAKEIFVSKNAY